MSTATLPPWLSPWSTGLVYGQRVYKASEHLRPLERSRHRPRLTIFTYGHGNSAPILRFSSWSEDGSGAGAGEEGGGGGSAAPGPGTGPGPGPGPGPVRWQRVPLDREPWHVEVPRALDRPPPYDVTIHSDVEYSQPEGAGGAAGAGGTGEALRAWSGVLRGWAAGATLLALLVIFVRIGERYLDWKILLRRRRLHREWQRANVCATSRLEGLQPLPAQLPDECAVELPPPYSACAEPKAAEEPPPAYSSCVQLINKNGPVIMYSREAQRRVDRILRGMSRAGAASPQAAALDESPAEHARLAAEIDRILRVCGVDLDDADVPPTTSETLSVYEQLSRNWPQRDSVPPLVPHLPPSAREAVNAANADAGPLPPYDENVAPNNPTDGIGPNECQNDAPDDASNGPEPDSAPAYTGADPLGVNNVPTDGSVVV